MKLRRGWQRGCDIEEWIVNWRDILDFEVYPMISSDEASKRLQLGCDIKTLSWIQTLMNAMVRAHAVGASV